MSVTYREFDVGSDADVDAAIKLISIVDRTPLSAADFLHNVRTWPKGQPVQRLVAEREGKVVGYSRFGRHAENPKNSFMASFIVDKEHERNGIGTELLRRGSEFARKKGGEGLCANVKDGDAPSLKFVEQRGFTNVGREFISYLDLAQFDMAAHSSAIGRAESQGYQFTSLAELGTSDKVRAMYHTVYSAGEMDMPGSEYYGASNREDFEPQFFSARWYSPEGAIVALHGGEIVGLSNVCPCKEEFDGEMFTELTAVAKDHRGCGLAYAMKVLGIQHCINSGGKRLRTENDTRNAPMLAVNTKLGFIGQPGLITVSLALEADE